MCASGMLVDELDDKQVNGVKIKLGEIKWRAVRSGSRIRSPNMQVLSSIARIPAIWRSMIRALISDALDFQFTTV
jgi:hypothetical protein